MADLDGTLNVSAGAVTYQLGQEIAPQVRNGDAGTLANGVLTMYTGTIGASGRVVVEPFVSDGTYPSFYVAGVTTESILTGEDGKVTHYGVVRQMDTSAWSDGDLLYSDPASPGDFVNVQPAAPNIKQPYALVIFSHAGNGSIFVRIEGGTSLANNMSDVEITSVADFDRLEYNDSLSRWENTDALHVGDDTDYLQVNNAGHLELFGEATVWDDSRVPITSTRVSGSKPPTFKKFLDNGSGSQGVSLDHFSATQEQEVSFVSQFSHKYKHSSDIEPHFHWSPTDGDTGDVVWGIEFTWANISDLFPNTVLLTGAGASTGQKDHLYTDLPTVSGTGKTGSSMIVGRIFRDATNVLDTYTGEAALLEFDWHRQEDKLGSDNEIPGT